MTIFGSGVCCMHMYANEIQRQEIFRTKLVYHLSFTFTHLMLNTYIRNLMRYLEGCHEKIQRSYFVGKNYQFWSSRVQK